eukprot:107999_1
MNITLPYIMGIHDKIQHTPASNIKQAITSMNNHCLKALLLVFCKYYYNPANRKRLKTSNNQNHLNIMQTVSKLKHKSVAISSHTANQFNKLPQILISYIISFLHHKSRVNIALVSRCFLQSRNCPLSISNLEINRKFINKSLAQIPQHFNHHKFSNLRTVILNRQKDWWDILGSKQIKSENVRENAKKIFESKSIKHIHITEDISIHDLKALSIYNILSQIEQFTINAGEISFARISGINVNLNSSIIKSLTITSSRIEIREKDVAQSIRNLYIKKTNENNQMIDISFGDAVIKKYIIPCNISSLTYLEIEDSIQMMDMKSDNTTTPHIIFWLWNIPNLQTCKLTLMLPKANISEKEFEKLLVISTVIETTRNQKGFTCLSLNITTRCTCWACQSSGNWNSTGFLSRAPPNLPVHRKDCDNTDELLTNDLNIFLKYLNKLYPNLKSIQYQMINHKYCIGSEYRLQLDWKAIFHSIQHINIDVLSLYSACDMIKFLSD